MLAGLHHRDPIKHQTPRSKFQRNSKSQSPKPHIAWFADALLTAVLGWPFEIWSLEFGCWSFRNGVPSRNLTSNLEFRTLPLCALSYGDGNWYARPVTLRIPALI